MSFASWLRLLNPKLGPCGAGASRRGRGRASAADRRDPGRPHSRLRARRRPRRRTLIPRTPEQYAFFFFFCMPLLGSVVLLSGSWDRIAGFSLVHRANHYRNLSRRCSRYREWTRRTTFRWGHRIAMQCVSQLRDKIPVALSLSDFFKMLRSRSRPRWSQRTTGRRSSPCEGVQLTRDEALPLKIAPPVSHQRSLGGIRIFPARFSNAQRRLWFIEQLNPGLPLTMNPTPRSSRRTEYRGVRTSAERYRHAARGAAHHDPGDPDRTRAGCPRKLAASLKKIDLSAGTIAERKAEVDRLLIDEPRSLYHLETEPGNAPP